MVEEIRNRNIRGMVGTSLLCVMAALGFWGLEGIKGGKAVFIVFLSIVLLGCVEAFRYFLMTWGTFRFQGTQLSFKGVSSKTLDVTKSNVKKRLYYIQVVSAHQKITVPKRQILFPIFQNIYNTIYGRRDVSFETRFPIHIRKPKTPLIILNVVVCSSLTLLILILYFSKRVSLAPLELAVPVLIFSSVTVIFLWVSFLQVASIVITEEQIKVRYWLIRREKIIPRERVKSSELFVDPVFFRLRLILNLKSKRPPHKLVFTDADWASGLTLYDLRQALSLKQEE